MSDQELMLIEKTVDAIVAGAATAAPRPTAGRIDASALELLAEAGLRRVALAGTVGGGDGQLDHLAVILRRLAYHAVNVPLLEDHVAAELLAAHSVDVPAGLLTVASRSDLVAENDNDRLLVSGRCVHVPWGRAAEYVIACAQSERGPLLVVLPVAGAAITLRHNVAGEARDVLTYEPMASVVQVPGPDAFSEMRSRVLLYRSLMMLGAGERALEMTTQYVVDRTQFGRALAHRQVVQHYVAEMFGALTATRAACDAAIAALMNGNRAGALAASLATRVEADRMASLVARLAHQLHGAIGVTQEHPLHLATTRLASWRQDDLSEGACSLELSRLVRGFGGPWKALTGVR